MEKKSYISSIQIVLVLFVTRLLFSTSYQSTLKTGNSIQDLLLSIPVNLITNFIIAIPLLILLKKHPGHDPIECMMKAAGHGIGTIVALFYYLFFLINAVVTAGNYENFFTITVIPDVSAYVVGFLLMVVCVYGALKGIEAIVRVGSVVAVFYILVFAIIFISVLPQINLSYLKPLLFDGTSHFISGSMMNYNLSTQIVALAFLAPFMRQGGKLGKVYSWWNVVTIFVLFLLEFNVVTTCGAFGSEQQYPLQLLSTLSQLGVFQRIDSIDMVSWILNTIITVAVYLYLAISCLLKTGLNKHRRLLAFLSGGIVFIASPYISRNFLGLQSVMVSGITSLAVTAFTVVIPLIILVVDLIKGKVVQNAQNQ